MAEVYLAVVAGPGGFSKLTVVKVMKPELLEETEHRAMFLDEGRLAARLNHPNVVQTNEVQIEGDQHFIAMEYLDGQPLHRIVRRANKAGSGIPLNWHLHFLCEVLKALDYAHSIADYDGTPLNVVHRDVTPHNVFVTYTGQVKLCDFGIAKTMSSSVETRAGVLKGKVSYMAPEQVLSQRMDNRADLFAVGVMLWEAATGKRMWKDQGDLQIMQALSQGRVPAAREANPSIDADLEAIVNRALAPNPEDRYRTAADFRRELEGFLFSRTSRIKPEQIGEWVAQLFEKERANLQTVIQDQLSGKGGPAPALDPPRVPMGDSSPSKSVENAIAPSGRVSGGAQPSYTIPSVEVHSAQSIRPPKRRTTAALVGALAASSLFLMVLLIVVLLKRQATPTPSVELAAPPPSTATAETRPTTEPAEPAPARVQVKIRVSPRDAKITLDGEHLVDNPWVAEVPRGQKSHSLVVEADGYETERRSIVFDSAKDLEIALRRKASSGGVVIAKPAAPEKPTEEFPDLSTAPKKKPPSTQLDTEDPWK